MSEPTRSAPVCLVDASVYIFRAYHSLPPQWQDPDGWPTNAAYGFGSFLLQLLEHVRPQRIAVCFDEALGGCFRNSIYPAYKANRDAPDEALLRQFGHCREIARALGLAIFSHPNYEADDLIGTLATRARAQGHSLLLISADKDLTQLLAAGDVQWDHGRDRRFDCASVLEHFGVRPDQIADLLALAGDPIDNIPGVRGVGRVSAAKLLRRFEDLDQLYARLDEVAALPLRGARALQARLAEQRELAFLSRRLTRIACDAPLPEDPDQLIPRRPDLAHIATLFEALGFGPFLQRRAEHLATAR